MKRQQEQEKAPQTISYILGVGMSDGLPENRMAYVTCDRLFLAGIVTDDGVQMSRTLVTEVQRKSGY